MGSMDGRLLFSESYRENLRLGDGTPVRIRILKPKDREKIEEGFRRLSSRSRYLRFLTPKRRLNNEELRYLTELDGVDHFGLVAALLDSNDDELRGIGIGRFLRCVDQPAVAEPAVTVADEFQGRGLGSLLCLRLATAAQERGITRFRCYLLSENRRVQNMIRRLFPDVHFEVEGELTVTVFGFGKSQHTKSTGDTKGTVGSR
jgi:GNAT superfamily N-acetyltransferase